MLVSMTFLKKVMWGKNDEKKLKKANVQNSQIGKPLVDFKKNLYYKEIELFFLDCNFDCNLVSNSWL